MSNNPFLDYQQQFFKTWTDNMSKIPGMEAYQQMFQQNSMPNLQDYWKNFVPANLTNPMDFWKNLPGMDAWKNLPGMDAWKNLPNMDAWKNLPGMDYWKTFQNPEAWKSLPGMDFWKNFQGLDMWKSFSPVLPNMGDFSNMFNYKIPGMELYTKVFDLWKGLGNPVTFAQDFQDKYLDLVQDVFHNAMPGNFGGMLDKPMELMDTCVNFYKENLAPWMEIDPSILNKLATGDSSAYTEFFQTFNEKYDETIGKYFEVAGLGLNRESNEEQMHAVNAYYKAMFASAELASQFANAMTQNSKTLAEQFEKAVAEGKNMSTFRDFYNLWYKNTEDALMNLFATDEFTKVFNDFAEKYGNYMSASNKVMERALSSLPIPTNTDMRSLYKTVYDLRKQVRDLTRAIAGMTETKKEG